MKKVFLNIILISAIGFLIIPQVALAAWYNPFSWFSTKVKKIETVKTIQTPQVNIKKQDEAAVQKTTNNTTNQKPPAKVQKPLPQQAAAIATKPITSANSSIKDKISYIVQIVCPVNGGTMSGTGELIYGKSASDNQIITNKHVLNGATGPCGIYRTLNYENRPVLFFKSANSFVFSKNYDLAIITPDNPNLSKFTNTNLAFSTDIDLLDKNIYVLGYPASAGTNITLTKGIISGTENINGIVMYKTDAKIDSGNSGGAVFDENGKFIGIPTLASQGDFSSYGYIIPAKIVKNFINIVEQEGYGKQNWQHPEFSLYTVSPSNTVPESPSKSPDNPAPGQQEDTNLKIAKCQANKQSTYDKGVLAINAKIDQMLEDTINKLEQERHDKVVSVPTHIRTQYGDLKEDPFALNRIEQQEVNSINQNYQTMKSNSRKKAEDLKKETINKLNQAISEEYSKCLNQ